jgi:hypothetical protein
MPSVREYKRRLILPLAGLGLGAYYLFVFLPLGHQARSLDGPLQRALTRLAISLEQTNAGTIDFMHITNQLAETRQALGMLESAKQKAAARLELGAVVRAKMNAPFQLVEYENERSKLMEELTKLAKQNQATLDPPVLAGFPEQTADTKQPELLWPALSLINDLLRAAIQCKVAAIHSLEVPLAITNAPSVNPNDRLAEIPIQIEFTGPVANVSRLIQSLPLRADEIRSAGLPEAAADKPALFIDRLIIRKQSPDKPDEVRVSLRALGFVLRE